MATEKNPVSRDEVQQAFGSVVETLKGLGAEVQALRAEKAQPSVAEVKQHQTDADKQIFNDMVETPATYTRNVVNLAKNEIAEEQRLVAEKAREENDLKDRSDRFWNKVYEANADITGPYRKAVEARFLEMGEQEFGTPSERVNRAIEELRARVAQDQQFHTEQSMKTERQKNGVRSPAGQVGWQKMFEANPSTNAEGEAYDARADLSDFVAAGHANQKAKRWSPPPKS